MPTRRNPLDKKPVTRRYIPATSIEGREAQLVQQAIDLAERQIQDGTVSAQVLTHYLKLGSTREMAERAILANQVKVLEAKVDAYASGARIEELYSGAIKAMREYQGQDVEDD